MIFAANEVPDLYELAQSYRVPVLMHWQFGMYNHDFARFDTMLEKYPKVNFIGHAQPFWANIDKRFFGTPSEQDSVRQ